MATSAVSIVNSALAKLGVDRITSLSDTTRQAVLANEQYEKIRDICLAAHPWNFAIRRIELASIVETPAFGYTYVFQIPTDCVRVLPDIEYSDIDFRVEGRKIYTDNSTFKIKYITNAADVSDYSAGFEETLACRLAVDWAYALVNSAQMAQTMMAAYKEQLYEARTIDAQEGTPEEPEVTSWTVMRF